MIIKNLLDEDFSNYKVCSMFIGFPHCSFKCEKECGIKMCQNSSLVKSPDIKIAAEDIVKRYIANPLSSAVVFGGLEPFDDFDQMLWLIDEFRKHTKDTIVIYTGYNKDELVNKLHHLCFYKNIIIKYGRFIPNQEKHFDEVLGVHLASPNQYAEVLS